GVLRIPFKGSFEIADGLIRLSLARSEKAEIVPRIRYGAGIAGLRLHGTLEVIPCFLVFVLLEAHTAEPVKRFGAIGIVLCRQTEVSLSLLEIAAIVKYGAKGKVVAPHLIGFAYAGKRQAARHSFC